MKYFSPNSRVRTQILLWNAANVGVSRQWLQNPAR